MGLKREELIQKIIERLAFLRSKVEMSNPLNLTDVNILSENFYRDFLNLLYGYNLLSMNVQSSNAATIDLGDKIGRICFQVTATGDLKKTKKTVDAFIKNKLYEDYDRLIILNITSKTAHQNDKIGNTGVYELDTKDDIWDFGDLNKTICDLELQQLNKVCEFLCDNIKFDSDPTLATEIRTFIDLIEIVSDEEHSKSGTGSVIIKLPYISPMI